MAKELCMIQRTISIHSLRVEGDEGIILEGMLEAIFQSTPSVWRETAVPAVQYDAPRISIHSLRVEGDCPPV